MTSFTSSEKPVAAAAAGAFALAVAYFSWSSAKSAAAATASASKKSSSSSLVSDGAGAVSPSSSFSRGGSGVSKTQPGAHVDPMSLGAVGSAAVTSGVMLSASEDDYSPSLGEHTGETVASFIPEPFPDEDVAAFFAAFVLPKQDTQQQQAQDGSSTADEAGVTTTSTNADPTTTATVGEDDDVEIKPAPSTASFVTAGRSSVDVMTQCAVFMSNDAAFDNLKADAATDVVERAANLLSYLEWRNNNNNNNSGGPSTNTAAVAGAVVDDDATAAPLAAEQSATNTTTASSIEGGVTQAATAPTLLQPTPEQLSELSRLIDARVETIEAWREHEAPMIRSIVRMLRDIREELANVDHYHVDETAPAPAAAAQKDEKKTNVVSTSTPTTETATAAEVVAAAGSDEGTSKGPEDPAKTTGSGVPVDEDNESSPVQRRDSIHPERVAQTAADIRERIRRLRAILEKLHTPLRELGPIGDLCNQLEAIAGVLAGDS